MKKSVTKRGELTPAQRAWVNALRSGEFKKAKGALTKKGRHCCLGVLCRISPIKPLRGWTRGRTLLDKFGLDAIRDSVNLRSDIGDFRKWVPLTGYFGPKFPGNFEDYDVNSLAEANDQGASFKEIADFIEANPEALFFQPGELGYVEPKEV